MEITRSEIKAGFYNTAATVASMLLFLSHGLAQIPTHIDVGDQTDEKDSSQVIIIITVIALLIIVYYFYRRKRKTKL